MKISKKQVFIGILVTVFLGIWLIHENWPIVQSETKIRNKMLKNFPVGTKRSVVWSFAQKIDPGIDGAYKDDRSWWKNNDQSSEERIGSSRVLGSISNIGIIDVTVIWLFDKDDKLIEIYAWKTIDFL